MHSSEPARKKLKTRVDTDVAVSQDNAKSLVQPVDIRRDLVFASDTSTCKPDESATGGVATVNPNSLTLFVLDTSNRLFVTVVTETQKLESVVQQLASQGCSGAEPGVLIHCRGQTQQDVSQTIAQLRITHGCTISLARPDNTARWKASLEMGSLFYELHDAHQAAGKAACLESMPEAMVERCRLAGEVQHQFLDHETRSQNCLDKLLGFLETDSIPVLADMCRDTKSSIIRNPVIDGLHWAACCRLVCVEGYTTTAMYTTSAQEDPALFPWVFLLLLGLTVASYTSNPTCHDMTPNQIRPHARQLQKLGETLDHMCNDWSPWSDLLPDSCFDVSAQQYILLQLLDCITSSGKVLGKGFQKLKAHVTTFTSTSHAPDESSFNLELTGAWSSMIQVFIALKSKLCIRAPFPPHQLVKMLLSYKAVMRSASECCQAVELFAAACIRLGIPQQSEPVDPYTGEPVPDLSSNPYLAAVPLVLRQCLAGMLPGIYAMSSATFGEPGPVSELLDQSQSLPSFLAFPIVKAVLKVADLSPGGALYRTVTAGPQELQEHFPVQLRRQYLHELFPDLSVDANYEEEPDHYQLIVPRDEFTQDSCPVSLTATVTRGLNIMFTDEMGQGSGVMKEWLCMVTQHVFGRRGGLFRQCAHDPATVHPMAIPCPPPQDTCPTAHHPMNLAGRLAGLALCYRCPIGIRLSRCFLKLLTGRSPLLSDGAQVDPQVCHGLRVIASATEQQLRDMQLTFEPPDGTAFAIPHEVEAAPGDPVTLGNRHKFIECLCGHFFSMTEQVAEFLMGLSAVSDWAAWREGDKASGLLLEKMLRPLVVDDFSNQLAGDLAPLDVQEWRQCTDAREFYYPQAHKDLDWFWEMIEEMADEARRELLCFWTSMSTVPAGGFKELSSKLKLQASFESKGLPTSHTCFFQLNLPRYASLEDMTAAFTRALKECKGFGFG